MRILQSACVALACILVGCGGSSTVGDTYVDTDQETQPPAVKASLEEVAESGQLGSAGYEIREQLEMMKNSGDAKAEGLLADLDKLESAGNPAAIKKLAKEMADKL